MQHFPYVYLCVRWIEDFTGTTTIIIRRASIRRYIYHSFHFFLSMHSPYHPLCGCSKNQSKVQKEGCHSAHIYFNDLINVSFLNNHDSLHCVKIKYTYYLNKIYKKYRVRHKKKLPLILKALAIHLIFHVSFALVECCKWCNPVRPQHHYPSVCVWLSLPLLAKCNLQFRNSLPTLFCWFCWFSSSNFLCHTLSTHPGTISFTYGYHADPTHS